MKVSQTEENYLKAIFKICESSGKSANTNAISKSLNTSAASVTDMLNRLSEKDLVLYARYKGAQLTDAGNKIATNLIRKHRLWEVFLFEKLAFSWDEVHEVAEQLEHIKSEKLVELLDQFLGFPKFDPHGDPIPDADGNFTFRKQILLSKLQPEDAGVIVGVQEHSPAFLQYLDRMKLVLGAQISVLEKFDYDDSLRILIENDAELIISSKVSQNIFVQKER